MQEEGVFLMSSVTTLLNMLPWKVKPILESFHHPLLSSEEMDFFRFSQLSLYQGGIQEILKSLF